VYYHKCGHDLPSHENTSYLSLTKPEFSKDKFTGTLTISLMQNDQAVIVNNNAKKVIIVS